MYVRMYVCMYVCIYIHVYNNVLWMSFFFQLSSLLSGQNWEWRTFLNIDDAKKKKFVWFNWLGVYLLNWLTFVGQ